MPSNIVKSFAEKTGKSEAEVEKLWSEAKSAAEKQYPEVEKDSDRYYSIVTGILKNMLGIKESFSDIVDSELNNLSILEAEMKKKKEESDEESESEDEEDVEDEDVEDEEESDEDKKKKMKDVE